MKTPKTHDKMVKVWMKDPAFKMEYDALEEEFLLLDMLVKARTQAGLTQAEVAARMGTKLPVVEKLESGGGTKRHSPSIVTLSKYADAVGCKLKIKLEKRK